MKTLFRQFADGLSSASSSLLVAQDISPAAQRLIDKQQFALDQTTNRIFSYLMVFQYFAGIFLALYVSPSTWLGRHDSVHLHVFIAAVMGLAITIPGLAAVRYVPGSASTRHTIAVCQALWSALLIHLTGGRIEAHFHIFGSLAILAFYRDWKVLITASAVVTVDHYIRGRWFSESVFGIANASSLRWLEHAAWVVFEDIFLIISVTAARGELIMLCRRQTLLQELNLEVERKVLKRTRELQASNENLTYEMHQRQLMEKEREELTEQLVRASRDAGKAEIATGVLHNIGNILNSVCVSCNTIEEKLSQLRLDGYQKTVEKMREQGDRLGDFMGQAKGKCIPEYLARLTDCISEDRDEMRDEVRSLRGHINHIAEIVGMQQDHAKAGRLEENVQIADLVTDAININRAAMVRHAIEVESQVSDDLPVCLLDKHRVLQILVNLVRNAKHAVESKLPHERKITIRARVDNEQLFIVVDDNGMGISPENLTRIFGHGFTTKKQGHGFGLHSSANAAKELGGELSASSQGIGAGASFELRLPVRTAVEDTLPNECAV